MKLQNFLIYNWIYGSIIILSLTLSLTFVNPVCALLIGQNSTATYYTGEASSAAGI